MAEYNFPNNPTDGQIYPQDPVPPGVVQYIWSETKGTWLTISTAVQLVKGAAPIKVEGTRQVPIVTIPPATQTSGGFMSAADKKKLDQIAGSVQSVTAGIGLGAPETGDSITETGVINLLPATSILIGGVRPGATMQVAPDGLINAKVATSSFAGIVRPGQGLSVAADGTLNATGGLVPLRDISPGFNGSTTAFTLQRLDGSVFIPVSASQLMIFINGLILSPGNGYGVSGSQIVFTKAPQSGDTFYGVAIT